MSRTLRDHVASCDHPACAATRTLKAHGANLVIGKGRHCELAVLAAAGEAGMSDADLVSARRAYAAHLGVTLDGRANGSIADAGRAIHARHAAGGNFSGAPEAKHPINLGSARVIRTASGHGEPFDHYVLRF